MKISVAVITYNEADLISACLKSLLSQSRKPDEIILLDDGSTDNTVAIAKKFPIKVHKLPHSGMPAARDKVWRLCKNEIIVFAEADSVFAKTWLSEIEKAFKQGAEPFAVAKASGKSRHKGADAVLDKRLFYNPKGYFQNSQQAFFELRYSNYSPETAWAYRRKILEEIGGLNQELKQLKQIPWVSDDKLLAKKLLKAGYKITFAPKAIQFHKGEPKSLFSLLSKSFSKTYLKSKHYFRFYPEDLKLENLIFTIGWFLLLLGTILRHEFFVLWLLLNATAFFGLIAKMFFIDKSYKLFSSKYLPGIAICRILNVLSSSLGIFAQKLVPSS